MKKLLIASTALVATASVAAAEVTFGGYGRFGLYYEENDNAGVDETRLDERFRLDLRGTTETDGGVEFTARVRIESNDTANGQFGTSNLETPEFGVSAGGFTLFVGDTSDVLDSGDIIDYFGPSAGLTDFAEISSGFGLPVSGFGNAGAADPTVKAAYTIGGLVVAGSYTSNSIDDGTANEQEEGQIGVRYNISSAIGIGAVYGNVDEGGTAEDQDFWSIGLDGSSGALSYALLVADIDGEAFDTGYGASIAYAVGAATSVRFVVSDAGDNSAGNDNTAYAVGFQHSLGGGVSLRGGVGVNKADNTVADLGVRFNF